MAETSTNVPARERLRALLQVWHGLEEESRKKDGHLREIYRREAGGLLQLLMTKTLAEVVLEDER